LRVLLLLSSRKIPLAIGFEVCVYTRNAVSHLILPSWH